MIADRQSWVPDAGLVARVNAQFDKTIESYRVHPDLVAEHANHEESIRTGGYANRTLLELVQNAADALAGAHEATDDAAGRVEIVLDTTNGVLYCANGGRPFSAEGLTAITMAHVSGKRGDEIGRFGLGFKSVLAVSRAPQVFSRSVSFEFNGARAQEELARTVPAKRYPILRTASLLDAQAEFADDPVLADLATWATTVVKLPSASNLDRLRQEVEDFRSEFLLFVSAVREVRLRILGDEPSETRHISRDLGHGVFRIERPGDEGDEWFVDSRMHAPSREARKQVGEAVSRTEVKVTVALPTQRGRLKTGQFWSYFPLQDGTSASALLNAPWSVNDDRTTLLRNDYNREILATLAEMFVSLLPRVRTEEDPAAHLDYMPARGRESHGFGDDILTTHVPRLAAAAGLIPDARGVMRPGSQLRPLDFAVRFDAVVHQGWSDSPNTADDVPHWRCYASPTRATRLRDLFVAEMTSEVDVSTRDVKAALERLPVRGHLTWFREWAEGSDMTSAANALRTVLRNASLEDVEKAKVIPTSAGMAALADRHRVFLRREADIELDVATFITPEFLAERDIENLLKGRGFRDLDPEAILNARLSMLSVTSGADELTKLWDAALDVPMKTAAVAMTGATTPVKVPTLDGGWAWPRGVLDLDVALGEDLAARLLDRRRCVPDVAHRLGVVREPVKDFPVEDELFYGQYLEAVLVQLNAHRGPGERVIDSVELSPAEGPGPFSVLFMLRDAGATDHIRATWTTALLSCGDEDWVCEDLHTNRTSMVISPARWSIITAGLLKTSHGYRSPNDVVAPSLLRFQGLLPLFQGPAQAAAALDLPRELEDVPAELLREMLERGVFPNVSHDVLVEFVLTATRLGFKDTRPTTVPARVKRATEPRSPSAVYVATTDDQEQFLQLRERPYLRATAEQAEELVRDVGCRRFEDSFSFSMAVDGQREGQRITDMYPGLRGQYGLRLGTTTAARALSISKRVTTEDGVEDQPLDWHLDGAELFVRSDADERQVLGFVSEAFNLRLDNSQSSVVMRVGVSHRLEAQRAEARAAASDAERLECYLGPDDLQEALPKGLWSVLSAQGLTDDNTSVAELFLSVYGSESLKILADRFREADFPDVPDRWAGSPRAIDWVRKMGFGAEYAGQRAQTQPEEFVVSGAVHLNKLHTFQKQISEDLRTVLTQPSANGPAQKAMVELPTGAGKTRVATETILKLFKEEVRSGTVLWIAQSAELCEQAVQTFELVWRYLGDERPLTIGRLWGSNVVHEPDTELSVIVATDAQLDAVIDRPEYEWLSRPVAVFVDEAHRAGGSVVYSRILRWLGVDGRSWDRPLVGLSATPFKGRAGASSGTEELAARFGRKRLTAFEDGAYHRLVELGVLARVKHEVLDSGMEIEINSAERANIATTRLIDRNLYEQIGSNEQRMKVLVEDILGQDPDWPILVFTPSVLSAQVLAASLRYRGVQAESVSGQTGRQVRRDAIKRFQEKRTRVLVNCDLLVQGFDAPGVRALYIARPTFSPSAYIQMAGRGLRGPENGGKEECLIVDVADNWGAMNDFLGYHEYEDLWLEQRG